ncbi:hypothetical protein DPMN_120999 [Dreissena polymorpha]|uniref:Uncharacterized protein n=1 Tax=Dreissena polymorpha TaxID=45954 RepID=A0A9D4GLM1_DREPO|nr:hypothetical protein DPMN_120999 [Dreissena polymorpha]
MSFAFLRDKTEPDEGKLFLSSSDAKYYCINRDMLKMVEGVISRIQHNSKDLEWWYLLSYKPKLLNGTMTNHLLGTRAWQGPRRRSRKNCSGGIFPKMKSDTY